MKTMLRWLADGACRRPRTILILSLVLAGLCVTRIVRLQVTTSRTNLGVVHTRAEREFASFLKEFGTPHDLVVVIDGGDAKAQRQTADDLAREAAADPAHVHSTFYKLDEAWLERHVLLLVSPATLEQLHKLLSGPVGDGLRHGRPPSLADLAPLASEFERRSRTLDDQGYLVARDGSFHVVLVRPASRSDENAAVLPLVASVRAMAARAAARHPGVHVRTTGLYALQADEAKLVDHDMAVTSVVSLLLITAILLYGYRRPGEVALSLLPLLLGLAVTLAVVQLRWGYLNLVASSFLPILMGRGSDFAIYLTARYNAARERGLDRAPAVRESLVGAGGGIITGALVTAAAFAAAGTGELGAFSQLGVVVGLGLVLVLAASLIVTPALLFLFGDWRLPGERLLARLPRFRIGTAHSGRTLAIAGAVVAVFAVFARRVPFDYDLLKFLPAGTESAEAQKLLSRSSDFGTDSVVIAADSIEDARRKADALSQKPTVGHVESIASFLPPDGQVERVRALAPLVESIPPLSEPLFERARKVLLANVRDPQPIRLAELPLEVRERFEGAHGKTAVYVFRRQSGEGDELAAFVADVRQVAPEATGFPMIYYDSSRAIRRSFLHAAGVTLGIIVLALALHFRRVRPTLLALVPLGIAAVAMGGLMHLLSIPHNMANVVALPLLLGLGTDYGLQILHHRVRFPGEPLERVVGQTGLGVLMAGGTTAAGFGALALATHLGARSLGLVLLLGTCAALLAALAVLPALLAVSERWAAAGRAKSRQCS